MNCLNCGEELRGAFCHACGQKATAHRLGMHDVAHDAIHELLHLDGKILQTMKLLLFKPGQLTREFIEGKRVRYISPIRLYLTWSVIFFALTAVTPAEDRIIKIAPTASTAREDVPAEEKRAEKIGQSLVEQMPRVTFALMPLFGLLTWLFYRRQQPFYIPHLYYSIHFHSFVFFTLATGVLLAFAGPIGKGIGGALFLTVFPYHFIALERVFGGRQAFWKGLAVGVLYWILLAATMVGVTLLMLRGI